MRLIQLAAIGVSLLTATAYADFGQYRSHTVDGTSLVVVSDVGELRITALDDAAFEVHYLETGVRQLPSFAIDDRPADVVTALAETDKTLTFSIDGIAAVVEKSPMRVAYFKDGQPLVSEEHGYFAYDTVRGFRFELDAGEKILGGGQRVMGMDRRGQRMPLYNKASYGYETDASQMYFSVPAIMSSDKYMIVFDNSATGWLDIGKTESDVLTFEAVGGRTAYIVVAGSNYPALMRNYTDVTGRQPLPPRWAFGNYASRFGYHTEKEARDVVKRFKRADIPLDAIILDIYWFGPDIQGHMGNLDWDRNAWPTPELMISDFAEQGVKTIAITEPFILSTSNKWQSAVDIGALATTPTGEPRRFDFYFGNTGLVDVFNETAQQWFWKPYAMLFDQGTAATWGDLGEPEVHPGDSLHLLSDTGLQVTGDEIHNAYGHVWAKMVYEKQARDYPQMRPLILMRSGFAGSQRYGMVPWSGDVSRSWGGFEPQIELGLQMSLFGLAYSHSDLGGFAGGETFDRELYTRWLQYGVFQPVYRPHAQEHIPAEPVFHDRETRNIVRDFIKLRYRLLPYIYTLAYENSTSGMPLMRPLFFEDESNDALIDEKFAYLWGDAFLVAPVLKPGVSAVDVNIPAGVWFDFWNDTRHEGSKTTAIPVTMETIPVLVRAGSFVPMVDVVSTTRDYSSENLTLHYYADPSARTASGQMYEDDGNSSASLDDGAYELLEFSARQSGDSLTIDLDRSGGDYDGRPANRTVTLVVHNWTADLQTLQLAGATIAVKKRMPKTGNGAVIDRKKSTLTVRFAWGHEPLAVTINTAAETVKPVVYQVWTRLFGNQLATNKPWGTIEQNGVGKFSDFDDKALSGIRELGVTHIWYTGVPHHALVRDYTKFGISNDDPDVVKGRAGSPYAVKDYYNVNPDLAENPATRLQEFEALISRTHAHGMKVVIDIVPNHVARRYESISRPDGVSDFGEHDDTSVEWARNNNFYYVVGQDFRLPDFPEHYQPLGGEAHPLADGHFAESPAKWTGNGARVAQPGFMDWFETVKINHGVRPDGSYAFDTLPESARDWSNAEHAAFWAGKVVPDSWIKFRDIGLYWLAKGVDGFRYDMAEMVPVEFWSYLNSSIKQANPNAFLLAEVYNPDEYRNYIQLGRIDYLYDKVGFYDAIKPVMQGVASTDTLAAAQAAVSDIEEHMLHFLENHDEERIASANFAGDANKGKPAMVVSALLGRSPTMIYFAQELGAAGDSNDANFNQPAKMRTTQYDYWGVPAQQRWMNGGKFDGGGLSDDEKELRDFYRRVLNLSATNPAMAGEYGPLPVDSHRVFAFARWRGDERLIVASNFDDTVPATLTLDIPADMIDQWQIDDGRYDLAEQIYGNLHGELVVDHGVGVVRLELEPLQSVVFRIGDGLFKSRDDAAFIDDPQGANVDGTLLYWKDLQSAYLAETRHAVIWLPPGYDEDAGQSYRVIYMSDGENLFDPRIASWGVDWGMDEAMMRGVTAGLFEPAIVVGTWSTSQRGLEYSPWHDAPQYARFLVDELMPRVNTTFRTQTGPNNTFAMGSSMGGLLSFYLVKEHPDVFGACGCVSSHFALSERMFADYYGKDPETTDDTPFVVRDIESGDTIRGGRYFFDYGTETLDSTYQADHDPVLAWFRKQGMKDGRDFRFARYQGADHSERAWRARVTDQLEWMLAAD